MNPFSIFVILYATASFLEIIEQWQDITLSWIATVVVILLVFTRITRLKFLIFLLLTTGYYLIFQFPDVPNHVNLTIYLNIALIVGGIYSYFVISDRSEGLSLCDRDISEQNNRYFEMMLPILRSSLIILYFWAGFHKLNRDFFNPQVSCSKVFFLAIVRAIKANFFGLPLFFLLIVIALACCWYLCSKKITILGKNKSLRLGLLATIIPLAWGISISLEAHANLLASLVPSIAFFNAIVVVTWELLGGLLLFVPKLQLPILLFSLMMHSTFALIAFISFGTLAFALLFTFIPQRYYQLLIDNLYFNIGKFKINRVYLYFMLNILSELIGGIHYRIHEIPNFVIIIYFLFYSSLIIFIYPLISVIFLPISKRPIWTGVSIFNSKMPKFMFFFPVFLVIFGFSSHLGLATTGTFSMFSNLKTEGATSNHLLLSKNPLKIFNYQEDIVKIHVAFTKENNQKSDIYFHRLPLKGHSLPVVEFKKLIHGWTKENKKVSMMFEYQGKKYPTLDIINDPTWKTPQQNWEMKLMDFRIISPAEQNECRW